LSLLGGRGIGAAESSGGVPKVVEAQEEKHCK
jgi:hypothetical protein